MEEVHVTSGQWTMDNKHGDRLILDFQSALPPVAALTAYEVTAKYKFNNNNNDDDHHHHPTSSSLKLDAQVCSITESTRPFFRF